MIPKVIHYCWFGGNEKSNLIKSCIESWKQYCPDYDFVEWNESNFDVTTVPYVQDAYNDRKWAFVSDYVRLYAVYTCGGVYLDTDVLLHSSIDSLLQYHCWLASDDVRYIATGLGFGAEKGNKIIKEMMDAYNNYTYPSGTNVTRDTVILERLFPDWKKSDRTQQLGDVLVIGIRDYGKYAKHLYTYTWADDQTRAKREQDIKANTNQRMWVRFVWKIKCLVRNPRLIAYFDSKRGTKLEKIYTFCAYDLLDYGIKHYIKLLWNKIGL